jgi:beta-glucosidase/6-phospho-beta-glucosidase/beta-galactosidase
LGELDLDLDRQTDPRPDLKSDLDFVGVDYYGSLKVTGTTNPSFPDMSPLSTFDPITLEADITDPDGLYEILIFLRERGLPAYVTETGLVNPNDRQEAVDYLQDHLAAVKRAIDDGADVRGFFCAYLTDGFEWNKGSVWKQGLYAVDPVSKAREPRATVQAYRAIAQARRLPAGSESP